MTKILRGTETPRVYSLAAQLGSQRKRQFQPVRPLERLAQLIPAAARPLRASAVEVTKAGSAANMPEPAGPALHLNSHLHLKSTGCT
jgi:hypothetical protein